MERTGIVIVTYNSENEIGACLDSCVAMTDAEIVVVDNASSDGTLAEVRRRPAVRLIANPENRGFAAAVNQGCAACAARAILLLNPDTVLLTPIDELEAACQHEDIGAASGMLVDQGGRPQAGFAVRRLPTPAALAFEVLGVNRLFPRNPVNRRYRALDADLHAPADVEQPAGAFLMLRRDLWRMLGGLDESFHPIWFEDVDLCRRIRDKGFRIKYVPTVKARHAGGASASRIGWERRQIYWYAGLLRYASKHFRPSARRMIRVSIMLASVPRAVLGVLFERSLRPIAVCWKIWRLAAPVRAVGHSAQGAGASLG